MGFRHFKGIWMIKSVNLLSSEIVGHRIAIGGRTGNVMILCVDDPEHHVHPPCQFDKATDRILGPTFAITRTAEEPRLLVCSPFGPGNTGSWTAEDPGGMGDGDDGDDREEQNGD